MDLISRQAAIDAIERLQMPIMRSQDNVEQFKFTGMAEAREAIIGLPSAQPEIIRCKDCKHRDPEDKKCDCGHDIRWQLPRKDNWYCGDAERRTDEGDDIFE